MGAGEVAFHVEPFGDGAKLRASFGGYESAFNADARSEPTLLAKNEHARSRVEARITRLTALEQNG